MRRALYFEVEGQRKKWKHNGEVGVGERIQVGLRMENVVCQSELVVGVNLIATRLRSIWPPAHVGDATGFKTLVSYHCG